ncbi:hypothetical protein SAMN04487906_1406 [Zhouia amylolytica]|uniref:Uncharacterized protein n=1 Tax=Zhouia amylolytica TaxID=376730 RepID=A0A1I6S3R2_9FLAO|nr:hypothetical protein [Zhouia amylolytica]MCQ0113108.1 hypothetical protein [Zhouia amylolytica]SFS71520.1 hypothetical protein SAMN04487906_1406 [Zhouia amylolytica]
MFNIKIINNFRYSGTLRKTDESDEWVINHNHTAEKNDLKSALLQIYTIGQVAFLDLGEKKIENYPYPTEKYGLLIRCHSTEVYYRYEEKGDIILTIDELGCYSIEVQNGTAVEIKLPELSIKN